MNDKLDKFITNFTSLNYIEDCSINKLNYIYYFTINSNKDNFSIHYTNDDYYTERVLFILSLRKKRMNNIILTKRLLKNDN